MNLRNHIFVQNGKHLRRRLNQCDGEPCMAKILRRLQTDESAADDDCGLCAGSLCVVMNPERIFHGAQRINALSVDSRNIRFDGLRTR